MGWTPPGASTWGGGYRIKLFSLAKADNKQFTFVGTRSNGPATIDGAAFPQKHEGTSGISIEDLQKNVIEKGALTGNAVKPHIILLHIGTNNMYGTHSATPAVLFGNLLDRILQDCPDALLVVSKLIPLPMNNTGIQTLNAAIPAMVEERAKAGAHIVLVDQNTGFPTSELSDQVHPNEAGYTRMAGVWYKAISQYLH
jgi:lysophospholipase L1-like esterase